MRTHSHEALVRTLGFAPISRVIWPVYRGGHLDLVTDSNPQRAFCIGDRCAALANRDTKTETLNWGTHAMLRVAIGV